METHHYQLSHRGKLILFHCKPTSAANDDRGCLTFSCLSFKREENRFVKAAEGAADICGKAPSHADVVMCQCAINVQVSVSTPYILMMKKSEKDRFQYSLLALSSSNQLEPCIEFKLPYEIRGKVTVLHGPTVMWSHAGNVFYTSPQAGEVRQIPIEFTHFIFGELPHIKERIFIVGVSENFPNKQLSGQTLGYFVGSGHVFDGTMIMPHPYISITQCILVLSAEKQGNVLKCDVVAATSSKQLVYFKNGVVKETCQLPFEDPESIQVVNTGRNGCMFVVFFHQGHVCAVRRETFQIAFHWSGVDSVHVEDFVGCGTDQMLLVFKDQGVSGQQLENFLLTDLCGISFANCPNNRAPNTALPPENHLLTLQALESRLQSGLTVLQELQREERSKERVLQQSLRVLSGAVSDREPAVTLPEQEGLVALWDCDDESKDEGFDDMNQDSPAVSSQPRVDKLWHRIAEDRMVVGVILTTDSSVPFSSVSLSILTETGQSSTPAVFQTQSQIFWLPAPKSSSSSSASKFPEPAAKRSRQHSGSRPCDLSTRRLAVTAATTLTPLLNSGHVECHVMLHYIQRRDAFALVSNETPTVLHCGDVSLDICSGFQTRLLKNPELKTDEALEDLLSLMAVLDHWLLHFNSPDYSLGDVDSWIQKRESCKRIEVSPQYLLLKPAGTSAPMLLCWHQISPFQGELSVHSSQFQLYHLLDSLSAFLPPTCSIKSTKGTRRQDAAQIFSLALEKEVMTLRECLPSLLCEEERQKEEKKSCREEEIPDLGSAGGLEKVREMWLQDVERSRIRLSPLVDVERYRRLTQSMLKSQLDADLAALLDSQRTLLS